jgi:hypothetical protein
MERFMNYPIQGNVGGEPQSAPEGSERLVPKRLSADTCWS